MAEYIIIVLLVGIIVIFAIRYFGGSLFGQFRNATQEINTAQTSSKDRGSIDSSVGPKAGANPPPGSVANSASDPAQDKQAKESRISSGTPSSGGIDSQVEELRGGVGDPSGAKPIDEIRINTSTLITLAVVVVGLGILIFVATMRKKKDGKKSKKKKKVKLTGEEGQAMVEFVLSAITFFFVILGVMQLAMVLNAYSLVRYAAYNAARAAIVHGGDQDKMEEAARLSLLATFPSHGRADPPRGVYENYAGAKATDKIPVLTFFNEPITKVELVRRPGSDGVVTFDDPKDTKKAIITVKVTHLYEMVIPLVNRIIFRVFMMIKQGGGYDGSTVDQLAAGTDKERRSGVLKDKEFRIPLVGVYTMRMQSDLS